MGEAEVSYTHKSWRGKAPNRYQVIDGVAGHGTEDDPDGIWWRTEEEVIENIKSSDMDYYTYLNGKKAYLEIVRTEHGEEIRSGADSTKRNNLMALPDFPEEISDVI